MKKLVIFVIILASISTMAAEIKKTLNEDEKISVSCYSGSSKVYGPSVVYGVTTSSERPATALIYKSKEALESVAYDALISNGTCVVIKLKIHKNYDEEKGIT